MIEGFAARKRKEKIFKLACLALTFFSVVVLIVLHQPVVLLVDDVIIHSSFSVGLLILAMSNFKTLTNRSSNIEVAHILDL